MLYLELLASGEIPDPHGAGEVTGHHPSSVRTVLH